MIFKGYIFLIYNYSKQEIIHSEKQQNYLYLVYYSKYQQDIFELPQYNKKTTKMIKESMFGDTYYRNLFIENYPNLEKIVVMRNSLKNLNSLKICNCEKLKTIEIEDGNWNNGSFHNVKNIIIESILEFLL